MATKVTEAIQASVDKTQAAVNKAKADYEKTKADYEQAKVELANALLIESGSPLRVGDICIIPEGKGWNEGIAAMVKDVGIDDKDQMYYVVASILTIQDGNSDYYNPLGFECSTQLAHIPAKLVFSVEEVAKMAAANFKAPDKTKN